MLEVDGLRTVFHTDEGAVAAVRDASFAVHRGKTLCLVGESGCGKSVAARSILQLVQRPGVIESGAIWLDRPSGQVDLTKLDPYGRELRSIRGDEIAMIFQEPMSALSPVHTIGNQIVEAIQLHRKVSDEAARARAIELLERVRMPEPAARLNAFTFELSGGMRQRAMIAMALACDPALLIADEPTTALDVTTQATILDLLRDLQREQGMALVLITHDLGVVAEMADEVAVMYLGRIVESGPVAEIFADPKHPYTQGLMSSIPRVDPERRTARYAIPGSVPHASVAVRGCAFAERCTQAMAGLCDAVAPDVSVVGPDHQVRCHLHDPGRADDLAHSDVVGARLLVEERARFEAIAPPPARSAPSEQPALVVRDVDVHYPIHGGFLRRRIGTAEAVNGVSITLRRGETVGLVGESGSGKTSLSHALVRLHAPTRGSVALHLADGRVIDVAKAAKDELREVHRHVRMIFQDPYGSLDPRLPVRDVVGEPIELLTSLSPAERDERVRSLLDTVGLSPRLMSRYVHAFSGGQRQRIGIARALATDPQVLIADEPVSALDVSVQAQVLNLLERLQAERQLTMLFVSHDLSVVSSLCDRVVVLYAGEVVEEAPAVELYRRPKHPYTEALLAAVPKPDPGAWDGTRLHLQGDVPDPAKRPAGCAFAARCRFAKDLCREAKPSLQSVGEARVACHFAEDLVLAGVPA
ncbi:MAG: dipeptide ABC transporter ATP-binding protein [Trueperaceae bacterium]